MHKSGANYYDLLQSAGVRQDNFSAWIDGYFADKYSTAMWEGFSFDLFPMMNYTYEQFQKELQVNVMATYVNPDSQAKARSTEGFESLTGTIPTLADKLIYDTKEIRDLMQASAFQPNATVKQATALLYRKVDNLLSSHVNSITYQVNQMKSNGKLSLLSANNPNGIQNVEFSANIPTDNTTALEGDYKWWTDSTHATEGTSADPIKNMKAEIKKLRNVGVTNVVMEVEFNTFEDLLEHSKVLTAIGYNAYLGAADASAALAIGTSLGEDARKATLQRILGCPINVVDHVAYVESWDKTTMAITKTQMNSFAEDVVVFRPAGSLGVIKHVMPLIPPTPNGGAIAQYFNGSLLLKIESDLNTKVQYFNSEQAVLAVIDKPKYVYRLEVL